MPLVGLSYVAVSNIFVIMSFQSICPCISGRVPLAPTSARVLQAYSEGGRDTSNIETSFYGTWASSTRPNPNPVPVPDGYRVVRPNSMPFGHWSQKLTLDARSNFCYERKPTGDFRLQCTLPRCAKLIQGCEFRKHLRVDHPGFSQDGRYHEVACIECKTKRMEVRFFADHILEAHCGVSTCCCAYCGKQLTRGYDNVTQHHMSSCTELSPYRHASCGLPGFWISNWMDSIQRPHLCEPLPKLSALVETGQAESSIQVPLQRAYHGEKLVIPSSLADTLCSELGVGRLLQTLNDILGTSYNLDDTPSLSSLLNQCISRNYDFGTAYGHLRPWWYDDLSAIQDNLRTCEERDREMRRNTLVAKRIVGTQIPPRRVWDLYSNRVVPWWVTKERWPQPISHAWVDKNDRHDSWTPINGKEWPVPIPTGVHLNLIRIEMLNLGLEYVWLDVLCLRQKGGPGEDLRREEWKVDVPTIGYVYRVVGVVVCYLSGLGRPFTLTAKVFQSHYWWFNRAWTLQEVGEDRIIAGDALYGPLRTEPKDEEGKEIVKMFRRQLRVLNDISPDSYNIFDVLTEMQKRESAYPVDKIAGLAFSLESATIPAYYENQSLEDPWTALVNTIIPWFRGDLFFGFPGPGTGNKKWRPSWDQVMAMPRQKGECGVWIGRDEEKGNDWCQGYCIEKGTVRGLDVERVDRRGELTIVGANGKKHAFQINAPHHYLMPEDTYTIIGAPMALENWVVGRRLPNDWFEKVSVFTVPNPEERKRLHDLEVTKALRNYLV